LEYQLDMQPVLIDKLDNLFDTVSQLGRSITVGSLSSGIGVFEMVVETFQSVWHRLTGKCFPAFDSV
jgi:hypothetical protein